MWRTRDKTVKCLLMGKSGGAWRPAVVLARHQWAPLAILSALARHQAPTLAGPPLQAPFE